MDEPEDEPENEVEEPEEEVVDEPEEEVVEGVFPSKPKRYW